MEEGERLWSVALMFRGVDGKLRLYSAWQLCSDADEAISRSVKLISRRFPHDWEAVDTAAVEINYKPC